MTYGGLIYYLSIVNLFAPTTRKKWEITFGAASPEPEKSYSHFFPPKLTTTHLIKSHNLQICSQHSVRREIIFIQKNKH